MSSPIDYGEHRVANTVRATEQVLEFHSSNGGKRKTTKADEARFRLDDEDYVMVKPKTMSLALMAQRFDGVADMQTGAQTQALVQVVGQMVGFVKQPGRDRLQTRLSDPADSLDLEDLLPIVKTVLEGAFGVRPTTSRPASSAGPRRSGQSSRVRTRSTRAAG